MAEQRDWADVGDRVRAARLAAGLSQGELAASVGLDRTMIAKIESGSRRVDALELSRLAAALGVAMGQFLDTAPAVLSKRSITLTDDTDTEVGRESSLLDIALQGWIRDLRQLVELGLLEPRPILTYPEEVRSREDARRAARWLRTRLGQGDEPINSVMAVCEQAGQFVLVTSVQGEGASAVDGDLAAAVVSVQGDPGRRRATAAHELGHLVLGDEYSSDLGVHASRVEREAVIDAFAAEVLLPVAVFSADARSTTPITRDRLLHIAAHYRTSWSLTLRQAEAAGVQPIARRWVQASPTRAEFLEALGWTPQPDLEAVRVPPTYAQAVMRACRAALITRRRAVELMHGELEESDLPADLEGDLAP
jgi:transcriptional regulator with XRE-family HTH domain/Zn-dependent peptidase ImmA (M78 family)